LLHHPLSWISLSFSVPAQEGFLSAACEENNTRNPMRITANGLFRKETAVFHYFTICHYEGLFTGEHLQGP
jgi:hypothetical protein